MAASTAGGEADTADWAELRHQVSFDEDLLRLAKPPGKAGSAKLLTLVYTQVLSSSFMEGVDLKSLTEKRSPSTASKRRIL